MRLDLLAIAAHPDDVELSCGGTLLKMAERGYKTGILDLTGGEMGTRGTPETRAKEAAVAGKILRVSWRGVLGVPDSDVQASRQHKLRLAEAIRELRPKTVMLPYWEARHPDHYNASKLGYEGCFLAGLQKLPIAGEAYRPFKILYSTAYADVRPSFVVDISAQFERRMAALLSYTSQYGVASEGGALFPDEQEIRERLGAIARFYGNLVSAKYGEPFVMKETMLVEDVITLGGRSI